jgi:hypothetical protein
VDNFARQLEAAAAAVDELELLDDELDELELELSDLPASDFFSDEVDVLDDSEPVEDPLDAVLAASRLSVR